MNFDDQKVIVGLLKAGQISLEQREQLKKYKKKQTPFLPYSYPDFGKSIVTRGKQDPTTAGVARGLGFGSVGAVLGALIARLTSKENVNRNMALSALGGGLLTGVPGYISGSDEAKSNYSKLLFLRRLGIRSKGERMMAIEIPGTTETIMREKDMI